VPYVRDEIKRLNQRYADRMEEHSNILATNLMKEVKMQTKKKITSRLVKPDGNFIEHIEHLLFKTCINCQMYY